MLVEDLMSTTVVTVDREATLADAAAELLDNGVGSVIIVGEDHTPIGILTESDLIRAGYGRGVPFAEIDVIDVGRRPVITTEPTKTVSAVARRMVAESVKKVPVMDDLELVGIITLSDIVWQLSDIRREAEKMASAREQWESRKGR